MTRAALTAALLVTTMSLGARAHAIDADALIVRGLDLRRAGKSAEALELFRRAHQEAPSPRTLGQMGLVETSLSRWTDADGHLAAALATPGDAWVQKNRPFLAQALDRAKTHIGELVISGRPGTEVFFDGKPLGALPLAAPARTVEGNFMLTATAATFKSYSLSVSIKGGARTAVTIVLEPVDVTAPVATASESLPVAGPPHKRARLWTGAGLVATGVGALAWGIAWIEVDNQGTCGSLETSACRTVYATKAPGWILAGAGGVLALAGGAVLFSTFHVANSDLALGMTPRSLLLQARF